VIETDFGKTKKNIFMHINGAHHLALIQPICKSNPDYDFYIYSENISQDIYKHEKIYHLGNVYFPNNITDILFKLNNFGLFIGTDLQLTSAHCKGIQLAKKFRDVGLGVIELQHGLFQLGFHYFSIPRKDFTSGDVNPVKSYADSQLFFYSAEVGANVIGYPPTLEKLKENYEGEYCLILSNLNWDTYTNIERLDFYFAVVRMVLEHKEKQFIWRMDHGELMSKTCKMLLFSVCAFYGIVIKNLKNLSINPAGGLNPDISSLVAKSSAVVSTVSTVLLDVEMYENNTMVFDCDSIHKLVDLLEIKTTFRQYADLTRFFDTKNPLLSGKLVEYDNSVFRKVVDDHFSLPCEVSAKKNVL
jgi:hypothetical protein|tara:strand:+ start:1104 stop:2177 length:1074 start_codon:yes stop_codon:yes gene_type:complete